MKLAVSTYAPNATTVPQLLENTHNFRAGLKAGPVGLGPRPPTKPFIFYFSLMIDAYETTT